MYSVQGGATTHGSLVIVEDFGEKRRDGTKKARQNLRLTDLR